MDDKANAAHPAPSKPPEAEAGPPGGGNSIVAILFVILLVAGGIWLAMEMYDNARYQDCAAARRRNCDNINYRAIPPAPDTK